MKLQWFHILLALGEGRLHGYGIQRAVLERTDGQMRLWPATLYRLLGILEAEGYIEATEGPEEERFRRLCLWAVAGNHLDFRTVGTGYGFDTDEIRGMLEEKVDQGFQVDEVDRIEGVLGRAGRVVYVPDNVGEIALDLLLVEHLQEQGAIVTVPYRGGPITSDATLDDFCAVGLDQDRHLAF